MGWNSRVSIQKEGFTPHVLPVDQKTAGEGSFVDLKCTDLKIFQFVWAQDHKVGRKNADTMLSTSGL